MRISIDRFARDALYKQALLRISDIEDIPLSLARGAGEEARRLRDRYAADTRLLDDLGWEPGAGPPYELTMPRADLARLMTRYISAADDNLAAACSDFGPAEREQIIEEALDLRIAAMRVLAALHDQSTIRSAADRG